MRGFALLDLGALRIVVEFRQQRAGLHEIALVRLDRDHLAGDLETDLGNDLRFDRADAEHPDFDILFGRRDADGNLARKTPIIAAAGHKQDGGEPDCRFEQARHQAARFAGQVEMPSSA